MPANLQPPYFEAEKRSRDARTSEENIQALEEMLAVIPPGLSDVYEGGRHFDVRVSSVAASRRPSSDLVLDSCS